MTTNYKFIINYQFDTNTQWNSRQRINDLILIKRPFETFQYKVFIERFLIQIKAKKEEDDESNINRLNSFHQFQD